jgi:outer membrane protein TolC
MYGDPVLDGLVHDALAANTDIRVAAARVEAARASLTGARLLPETTLSASANRQRISSPRPFRANRVSAGPMMADSLCPMKSICWPRAAKPPGDAAAQADADAVSGRGVRYGPRLSRRHHQRRALKVAQDGGLLDRSIRITGARVDVGRSDRLDLIRVSTLRDQQAASIPQLQADRRPPCFALQR